MKIGLDCDGVLADFAVGWRQQYNSWFNAQLGLDYPNEGWNSIVTDTHFAQESDFWSWADRVPDFWVNVPPISGAMGGVLELLKAKHDVCVVTHRHEKASLQTKAWLERYWPLGKDRHQRLPLVHHTKDKGAIDCQLYVDDGPKVLNKMVEQGRPCIKFSYPYNADCVGTAGSVKTWDELVPRIASLAEALV